MAIEMATMIIAANVNDSINSSSVKPVCRTEWEPDFIMARLLCLNLFLFLCPFRYRCRYLMSSHRFQKNLTSPSWLRWLQRPPLQSL